MNNTFFQALDVYEFNHTLFLISAISFYVLSLIVWVIWIPYQKKIQNFFGYKIFLIPSKKYFWLTTFFLLFLGTVFIGFSLLPINSSKNYLLYLNDQKGANFESQINQYYGNLSLILGSISSLFVFIWFVIQILHFNKSNKKVSENFLKDWRDKSIHIEKNFGNDSEILNLNYGYFASSCLRAIIRFRKNIKKTQILEEKYRLFSDLILKIMLFTFVLSKTIRKELLTNVYVFAWRELNLKN